MKKYIVIRCILLCLIVLLISGGTSALILEHSREGDAVKQMQDLLNVIALEAPPEDGDYQMFAKQYDDLSLDYRITVLNRDGTVLGDTLYDSESMENHANRPEIKQALAAGNGYEKRYSQTYGTDMYYVALRNGEIIYRIAAPAESIRASFLELFPALLTGLFLGLLLAVLLANRMAKSITRPLTDAVDSLRSLGEESHGTKLMPSQYGEIQPIVDTINSLTRRISDSMRELSVQKEKTDYLLDNMADGLLLVDGELRVRQANAAARQFLKSREGQVGENILLFTHRQSLVSAIKRAVEKRIATLFDITGEGGEILSAHVTPIRAEWLSKEKPDGAVLLITDVTRERGVEQLRREFVANASHELKTPITSISGFAELLSEGMVADKNKQQEYLNRIQGEARRMSALINDILKLSELENGEEDGCGEMEEISLKAVIQEASEALRPQMEKKNLSLVMDGGDISVTAWPDDIRSLVVNLLDNAVKYNRDAGNIRVSLHSGEEAELTVTDTGIGIPLEYQARIFERFYRVDKGRSRQAGGTGLGLSIVKHVVVRYGGSISLVSREGEGTSITVRLPFKKRDD